jgi:SP family galactose:H+ symporter-like MFS transporter
MKRESASLAEVTKHGHKPLVYLTCGTAALAGLLFGLDLGVISGALKFIGEDFGIGTIRKEEIVSALLWGATAGAILSGWVSKHLGRKPTLLIAAVIFALGSLASAVATSAGILIGVRVFLGVAVGMASFTAPLYLSEIAPKQIRGAMISMYQLLITVGIVGAFLSDTYFASYAVIQNLTGGHWRVMLGVLVIPATFMFVAVLFLPRSPRWLCLKGRSDEARAILETIRQTKGEIEEELDEIEENLALKQNGLGLFLESKFFRHAVFLGVGLQVIQQLTGINVMMYYAPEIFKIAGFDSTQMQMWGTVLVGATNCLSTFIAIALVDRVGRKPMMYAGMALMCVSMIAAGVCFNIGVQSHHALTFVSVVALLLFIVAFSASAGPIIWVLCSEIYPLSGRDFGITVSTATNWIVNGIVGVTFLTLLDTLGRGNTFLLYGGIEVLFIVFFLLFVPETKGASLEHISANLMAGKKLRTIGK